MRNEKGSYIIRLVAGAYLLYLSYSLIKSFISGEAQGKTVILIATIAFIILGVIILISGIRGMSRLSKEESEQEYEADVEEFETDAVEIEDQAVAEDLAAAAVIETAEDENENDEEQETADAVESDKEEN